MRSHLHPAVRHVGGLLQSQAGSDIERDTAAVGTSKAGLQQSSTEPSKSESQIEEYFNVKKQATCYINRVRLIFYGPTVFLWIDEKLHELT